MPISVNIFSGIVFMLISIVLFVHSSIPSKESQKIITQLDYVLQADSGNAFRARLSILINMLKEIYEPNHVLVRQVNEVLARSQDQSSLATGEVRLFFDKRKQLKSDLSLIRTKLPHKRDYIMFAAAITCVLASIAFFVHPFIY